MSTLVIEPRLHSTGFGTYSAAVIWRPVTVDRLSKTGRDFLNSGLETSNGSLFCLIQPLVDTSTFLLSLWNYLTIKSLKKKIKKKTKKNMVPGAAGSRIPQVVLNRKSTNVSLNIQNALTSTAAAKYGSWLPPEWQKRW